MGKPGESRPATFLPSQADDLDADGNPDHFEFPVELTPGESRQVDVYYSTKLTDAVSYPKQVQAKHTYGYNREVAALESELIGYRTYGGFFLDFMGRSAGRFGLNNDLAGYVSIYRDLGGMRCVPHRQNARAGRSLPAAKLKVFGNRPRMYLMTRIRPRLKLCRIIALWQHGGILAYHRGEARTTGILMAMWLVCERSIRSMRASPACTMLRSDERPLKMRTGLEYEVGFGIRQIPG